MANLEHLAIVRQGVETWNQWRKENLVVAPDLSRVTFLRKDTSGAFVDRRNLCGIDFSFSNLKEANLENADLNGANLIGADLSKANLIGANLTDAVMVDTDFSYAKMEKANFTGAAMGSTIFAATDLSQVLGLQTVHHYEPSSIGIDTIYLSKGKIPESFLRDCGVPEPFITFPPSLVGSREPFQYHSCFISYSAKDEEFAKRLHSRLRDAKVRGWFAPEDIKGGVKLYDQIERAIQLHDRLLVVLSDNSLQSEWVMTEIRKALEVEKRENRRKLFPIRLADFEQLRKWRCPDADSGKDLAAEVREYFIPDFSNWKDHDSFEKAFESLLRDLREAEDAEGAEVNGAQSDPQIKKAIEDGEVIVDEQSRTYEILIDCTGTRTPFNERDRTGDVLARQKRMSNYKERLQHLGYVDKQTKPADIDELRLRLTDEQRFILNTISRHFLDDGREREWIRSGFLYHLLGEGYDEGKVHSIIMPLGGSVVYETRNAGSGARYVLTPLGLLLTERGEEIEIVLVKHLEYVRQRFIETSGAGERVVLLDMAKKQELTSDQIYLLRRVLDWCGFVGGGSIDDHSPPLCVDELITVTDLRSYVREQVFSKFDPHVPIIEGSLGYRRVEMPSKNGLRLDGDVKQPAPVVYISGQSINFRGDHMGDNYNISGQAGAVGQNAHANDMTFNQIVNHFEKSIDLPTLEKQLAELRQAMSEKQGSSPQTAIALGKVAEAEIAAQEKNPSKVMESLKAAGQWTLDFAKEIGKDVVVEAVKQSMGMP